MANLNTKTLSAGVGDILCVDGGISGDKQIKDGDGTASNLYIDGTNLGIGVSTPTKHLQVGGDITVPASSKLFFDGGTHTYITESDGDVLDFYAGNELLLRLSDSSGADTVTVIATNFEVANTSDGSPSLVIASDPGNDKHMIKLTGSGYGSDTLEIGRSDVESGPIKIFGETTIHDELIAERTAVTNLADDGSIPITATCVSIDANGSARTGIRFAGTGTAGQIIIVNNTGGEALTFHNTEGTAKVRGIHADHDTMEANFMGMFVSDGSLWNLIAGGIDSQPDAGLTAS